MDYSIIQEFQAHAEEAVNDNILTSSNQEEWHYLLFNANYYVIGYYACNQWLKKHNIDPFEAIGECQQYEKDNFGECRVYDNSETTVNMYVYVKGEEWLHSFNGNSFIADLLEESQEEE